MNNEENKTSVTEDDTMEEVSSEYLLTENTRWATESFFSKNHMKVKILYNRDKDIWFQCAFCGKEFNVASEFIIHLQTHDPDISY